MAEKSSFGTESGPNLGRQLSLLLFRKSGLDIIMYNIRKN